MGGGRLGIDRARPFDGFGFKFCVRYHAVDRTHVEHLFGGVGAAEEEDFAGEFLADHLGQVGRSVTGVEGPDIGIGLLEPGVFARRQSQIADHMERVAPARSPAVDQANNRFGHGSDQALYLEDMKPAPFGLYSSLVYAFGAGGCDIGIVAGGVLVPGAAADTLISAGAKRPAAVFGRGAVAGEQNCSDIGGAARMIERAIQLVNGMGAKRVAHFRAVKGDSHNPVCAAATHVPVVGDVGEILKTRNRLPLRRVEGAGGGFWTGVCIGAHILHVSLRRMSDAALPDPTPLPPLDELRERTHVVRLPMRVRFRGITEREVMLFDGPAGWAEFAPFLEYEPPETAAWLAAAVEMGWQGPPQPLRTHVPINATVPDVAAEQVPEVLAAFPGCTTVKVKVASRGPAGSSSLVDDLSRIRATCAHIPAAVIRCDANGAWTVSEAFTACRQIAAAVADAGARLEYIEQPCASVPELAQLRTELERAWDAGELAVPVPIAADESIRRAEDPLLVAHAGAAERAVVKVPPLGGPRRVLTLAHELEHHGMQVTVSSALDSAVGIGAGLAAAAALPAPIGHDTIAACGLGTGGFFAVDVAEPLQIVDGHLPLVPRVPAPDRLTELAVDADRLRVWEERLTAAYSSLAARP